LGLTNNKFCLDRWASGWSGTAQGMACFFCGSDTTDCFARSACHDLAKNKAKLRSIAKHAVMTTSPMGQ